ncbi:MAG: hypothetical protein ACYC23_05810 [Limisphaerales bacterium]
MNQPWGSSHGGFIWSDVEMGRLEGDPKWLNILRSAGDAGAMVFDVSQGEPAVLDRVRIRLLREEERSEFDWRLEEQHYLKSSRSAGQSVRYVAELDGQ